MDFLFILITELPRKSYIEKYDRNEELEAHFNDHCSLSIWSEYQLIVLEIASDRIHTNGNNNINEFASATYRCYYNKLLNRVSKTSFDFNTRKKTSIIVHINYEGGETTRVLKSDKNVLSLS